MSKRDQGAAVGWYQEQGFLPEAVRNYLCLLGWSPKDDREILPIEEILPLFRWENMGHSNAKFDIEKCRWVNAQYLAKLDTPSFDHLAIAWLLRQIEPCLAPMTRGSSAHCRSSGPRSRASPNWPSTSPCSSTATPPSPKTPVPNSRPNRIWQIGSPRFSRTWKRLHPGPPATCNPPSTPLRGAFGIKPGALMFPLRVLTTGQTHGVDLLPALEWLGRSEALPRLRARAAALTATSA